MPETRARFLANTIGATSASNDFTLPDGVGGENQVISSDGAGGTTWANTLSAPTISSVTGTLNEYEDGVSEDGGVLTINGTDFGNDASTLSVQISGTTGFSTVAETTTISVTTPGSVITATFTGAETNYNHSSFAAGSTIYVKVTKSGLQTSTYATLATAMTGDPSFSTTSTTASTHTGTLAATSLGSYGGQIAGGGDDSNTKLLLNFDRTGGTDIEDSSNIGGDGHKITASGNAVIKASPFGDGKSAIFFNGSNDQISIANHADFQINSSGGSGTIEMWIYPTTIQNYDVLFIRYGISGRYDHYCTLNADGAIIWWRYDSSNSLIGTITCPNGTIVTNKWQHCAFTMSGTTQKIYVDGVEKGSVTLSGSTNHATDVPLIFGKHASNAFNGYMDEIRFIKGTDGTNGAIYTGDFDVPTSRLTAITNTKLLIHSDKEDDASDSHHTVSFVNSANFSTSDTLSWSGSHYDLTGSKYIKVENPSGETFEIPSSTPFCLEGWFKSNSNQSQHAGVFGLNDDGNACLMLMFSSSNTPRALVTQAGGSPELASIIGSSALSNNTWYHGAIVRQTNNDIKFYIDGAEVGSASNKSGAIKMEGADPYFMAGTRQYTNTPFDGYVQDVRLVIGSQVYSGAFTKPNGPLTTTGGSYSSTTNVNTSITSSHTKLLLTGDGGKFTDSATSGTTHTITPTGSYHSQGHGGIAPALTFPASHKKTGSAGVYFDGSGDYLVTDSIPAISGAITIDFWFYSQDNSDVGYLWDWRDGSANNGYCYVDSGNYVTLSNISSAGSNTGSNSISTNQWYHWCYSRDASGNYEIYLNGTRTNTGTGDTSSTSACVLYLGSRYTNASNFEGYITNFRISASNETASGGSLYHATDGQITVPTQIYGAYRSQDVGTIQLNATSGTGGGALDYAELSGGTALSTYGLSLSSSGAITGTLSGLNENSNSGGVIRIRARANADDNRVTTLGGSSFTGITQNDDKAPVLFNARRYVGTGTTKSLTGLGFQPDFVWIKGRDTALDHVSIDSVINERLHPNLTNTSASYSSFVSFDSDGFTVANNSGVNQNSPQETFIALAWKAGGAPSVDNSGGQTPTSSSKMIDGSISTANFATADIYPKRQSINTTGGFSITKYVGTSTTTNQELTVPHGLSGTPDFVIIKNLDSAVSWTVWTPNITSGYLIRLDLNSAEDNPGTGIVSTASSTTVTTKSTGTNGNNVNQNGVNYIMYAWKAVSGVSAFGTYTGGTSISETTNFEPKLIIIKNITNTEHWIMLDAFRGFKSSSLANPPALFPSAPDGEVLGSSGNYYHITTNSTGFTIGDSSNVVNGLNDGSSSTKYIYMAFA